VNYLSNLPCGVSLPLNNPHAVSVNFSTIDDVIAYEENDPEINLKLENAYPRFRMNRLLAKARQKVKQDYNIPEENELLPVSSASAFELVKQYTGAVFEKFSVDNLDFIALEKKSPFAEIVKKFIQHSGIIPSSRKAGEFLRNSEISNIDFSEEKLPPEISENRIKEILASAYGFTSQSDIFLCASGMNAIFTVFNAIKEQKQKEGKGIFIHAGWLYIDSMELLRKYSPVIFEYFNPMQPEELEDYVNKNKDRIAAIFTEIPNNPSIQCFDLPRLSKMTRKYNIPLVIDSTMSTPFTAHIFPYADVAVESLTKFACGHGDVMMGGIALNIKTEQSGLLKEIIAKTAQKPFINDICRLAFEIESYETRMKKVSKNTFSLADYFQRSLKIKKLNWALDNASESNFRKIQKSPETVPGLLSVVFDKELKYYFDRLRLPKGPSLGTDFTLAMPYVYLAHYNLLKSGEGRKLLRDNGIDTELLRISVGLEDVSEIINVFEEALNT
jgi:cystathionine gamma-synthase